MKKYLLIVFGFIFAITLYGGVVFADNSTTGFIPGQIWYSKQPLIEGETVDIHTIVWNGDTNSLSANVEFYDKNVILGSRSVSIPAKTSKDVSVSWKITAGDHLISASIISSKIITGSTTQSVTLTRRKTGEDKQFVSKVVETISGTPVSSADVVQNKIGETASKIVDIIPASVSTPISNTFSSVDDFRMETSSKIQTSKVDTQKKIDALNKKVDTTSAPKTVTKEETKSKTGVDGTEKPIALVKLFFLAIAGFIFSHKFIFYGLLVILAFLVLRFFYRKIRNR